VRAAELRFDVPGSGSVSALIVRPAEAAMGYVLAHGAGAGMRHAFLEAVAARAAARGIATFRYQFPYMEAKRGRPDRPDVAVTTVRAAVGAAAAHLDPLPLIAGGKSFGARMTSTAAAEAPLRGVRGLAFLGFPLHAPGKPGTARAEHLDRVGVPMLFLQGTRDEFADLALLEPVVRRLGERATLHRVEGGDHSFRVPKRAGRSAEEVLDELADALSRWAAAL
jgi:predicted alpha/beta-hydrolase family hydrolase